MRGRGPHARPRSRVRRGPLVAVLSLALVVAGTTVALRPEVVDASFTSTARTDAALTAGALTGSAAPATGTASFTATPLAGGCSVGWSALSGGTAVADRFEVTEDTRSVTTTTAGDVGAGTSSDVPDARGVLYRLRTRVGAAWVSPDAENRFAVCQPLGVGGLGPGRFLGCALDSAGGWWCWGAVPQNTVSVSPVKVGGSSTFRQVGSFGETVLCAIRTDSTLWCLGTGTSGQLGQGTTASSATPVQVTASTAWRQLGNGGNHVCATRTDDTLWCWGQNSYGQLGDASTTNRTSPVQVGSAVWLRVWGADRTTCALRTDGTAWCWGLNTYGQIGTGTAGGTVTTPSQVGAATDWVQLAPSRNHVCGLRAGGTLWCWGYNNLGQLGDGTTTDRLAPTQVGAGSVWTQVATYVDGSCAMRSDGTVWCWGNDSGGRTGQPGKYLGTGTVSPAQVGTDADWRTLVAGQLHVCAVKADRTAWCWGDDRWGQSGSDAALLASPRQVTSGSWGSATAGNVVGCAVRSDGSLWCWGRNNNNLGSFPDPTVAEQPVPRQVVASGWAKVTAGQESGCGVRADGTLWCWGLNFYGEAAQGTTGTVSVPTQVGSLATWADVRSGYNHVCGLLTDGSLWCWGRNGSGRLGDGTTTQRTTPVQVGSATWSQVAAGFDHTCGLQTDGSLWCWGNNGSGQVGDGTTTQRTAPVRIGASTWLSVSAGNAFSCGVRSDGTLWCWGLNGSAQLADGTTTTRTSPVQVGSGTTWQSVLAGSAAACARRADATLWCWGGNDAGQSGQGTFSASTTPAQVLTDVADLAPLSNGNGNAFQVLKQDGTLWAWGRNDQFVVGTGGYHDVPVQVLGGATWGR